MVWFFIAIVDISENINIILEQKKYILCLPIHDNIQLYKRLTQKV